MGLGPLVAVPRSTALEACAAASTHHRAGMEQDRRWLVRIRLSPMAKVQTHWLHPLPIIFMFHCLFMT